MVGVGVLGEVRARVDDHPADLGGSRRRAVLGLLVAGEGRVVSTDRLLEDLWSGEPPPQALGSLQTHISHLRRALEPQRRPREPARVIVSTAPGYRLDLPADAVDAWRFARLVEQTGTAAAPAEVLATAGEALALWTGEPFAAYAGQEWAELARTRLHGLRSVVVERHAEAALELGRTAEAVLALAEHVRDHPLREHAVALLAVGLYRQGRQGEALAAVAAARRTLAEELGLDLGAELRTLEADLLAQAPGLDGPRPAARGLAPGARRPAEDVARRDGSGGVDGFVGRRAELARLTAAAARRGRPAVVWVVAEAGAGKSALLEEFCSTGAAGRRVAAGRCAEVDGAPPGWTWLRVLESLDGQARPAATAFETAQEVEGAVAALNGRPVLVALDDLHRADQGTLQILRHLLGTDLDVLVVATLRSDEVGADLAATLAATADLTADRLVLGGLAPADCRDLVRGQLGADLTEHLLQRLVDRSAGSPLFLRQLVRLLAAEGPAAAEDGLPSALQDVLRLRLARLPATTADQLARAAVLGREVDVDLLVRIERERGTATEDEVLGGLDSGLVTGLLQHDDGGLRFSHALVRDVLYERLPPLRRARLHQAALAILERDHPDRLSVLAHHARAGLDASTASRALPHLLAAADEAVEQGALHDSVGHLRAALRAALLAGTSEQTHLPVHRRLVAALTATGDLAAARVARDASVAAARRAGDAIDVARAHLLDAPSLLPLHPFDERTSPLVPAIVDLLERIGTADLDLRVQLLVALVREVEPWGDDVTDPAVEEALRLSEELGDPLRRCQALNARYLGSAANIDPDLLRVLGNQLLDVARPAGLVAYEALGHEVLTADALSRGDLPRAREHTASGLRLCSTGQLHRQLVAGSIFASTDLLLRGDLGAAAASFDRVARQLTLDGDPNSVTTGLFCAFTVGYAEGDAALLVDRLAAFSVGAPRAGHDLLVSALLDAGEETAARARYDPRPWPEDPTWLYCTALATDNAYRLGDPASARDGYQRLLPFAGRLACSRNGALPLGPVDHFLGVAALAQGHDDLAARHLAAAAAATRSSGPPGWRGRVRSAQDEVRRRGM